MTRRSDEDDELVPLPVGDHSPPGPGPGLSDRTAPLRPGLDRRWRALGLGALLAVLVGAGALSGIDGDKTAQQPAAQQPADPAPPGPGVPAARDGDEPAPEGWRRGSPGPLRHRDFAVRAWTGSELVVWGGDPAGDSGAAYDPAADRWRVIAPAPIPARCQGVSAWTGREVLVWGQACRLTPGPSPGRPRHDIAAAAYDPTADRWRVLPTGPVVGGPALLSVWTGTEWVLANPVGPAAAFDPASDRWRSLPAVPRPFSSIVGQWTGREVVVLGREVGEKGPAVAGAAFRHWAAALDPGAGRWRGLPEPEFELAATAVWDAPQGALLDEVIFAEHCGRGALFHPRTGTWKQIPHPRSLSEPPVWTGRDALFWIGSFAGSADGVWLYGP